MIGYDPGHNDLPRAAAFYDALLAEIGARRLMDFGRGYAWGVAMDKPALGIMTPFDGKAATAGNGTMIAIVVDSRRGRPRVRKGPGAGRQRTKARRPARRRVLAGYFRDLDGNKLNVFCMG